MTYLMHQVKVIFQILFCNNKNIMPDCCYTHKKLIDYRNTILPKVKSNWELLSESEKGKHLNVNEQFLWATFYCCSSRYRRSMFEVVGGCCFF